MYFFFDVFEVTACFSHVVRGEYEARISKTRVCVELLVVVADVWALVSELIKISNKHTDSFVMLSGQIARAIWPLELARYVCFNAATAYMSLGEKQCYVNPWDR
nr:hypothetical protein [Corynebacterium liangguodongii]